MSESFGRSPRHPPAALAPLRHPRGARSPPALGLQLEPRVTPSARPSSGDERFTSTTWSTSGPRLSRGLRTAWRPSKQRSSALVSNLSASSSQKGVRMPQALQGPVLGTSSEEDIGYVAKLARHSQASLTSSRSSDCPADRQHVTCSQKCLATTTRSLPNLLPADEPNLALSLESVLDCGLQLYLLPQAVLCASLPMPGHHPGVLRLFALVVTLTASALQGMIRYFFIISRAISHKIRSLCTEPHLWQRIAARMGPHASANMHLCRARHESASSVRCADSEGK